jgi:hypothetical protein
MTHEELQEFEPEQIEFDDDVEDEGEDWDEETLGLDWDETETLSVARDLGITSGF